MIIHHQVRQYIAISVAALLLAVSACATEGEGASADVSPTTTTVVNEAFDDVVRVSFDGTRCTVEGPSILPAGTIVPLVFTNTSDSGARAHIARLEEGHIVTGEERTFEDFVALQSANGGAILEDSSNVIDSPINWLMIEPVSFNRDAYWPAKTLDDNQTLKVHQLSNQLGTRIVYVSGKSSSKPEYRYRPDAYWFCAQLEVTAIEF